MKPSGDKPWRIAGGITVLYEDSDIVVVNKPSGLLTVGTEREKRRTAYYMLTDYVRKGYSKSRNRIFIVHRLDRDTSGILVFAKNEDAKNRLQNGWDGVEKKYSAIVHGRFVRKDDTITSYLTENSAGVVYSTDNRDQGKLAKTVYKVVRESDRHSLLDITLLTGRKNQIRVHLAEAGHPVVGDVKYGGAGKSEGDLALHARSITINHPFSGKRMTFEADLPPRFNRMS